jgi:hypothetical protein
MADMRTPTPSHTEDQVESEAEPGFVATAFEACASFAPGVDGSPVCDACGWLLGEHADAIAEVRALPGAVRAQPRPKRLAS